MSSPRTRFIRSRRRFLETTLASGAALALPAYGQAPGVITSDRMRPQATLGMQIGDVTGRPRASIWSRADRPARLIVERALREDFARRGASARAARARRDGLHGARLDLTDLPADARGLRPRGVRGSLDSSRTRSASR